MELICLNGFLKVFSFGSTAKQSKQSSGMLIYLSVSCDKLATCPGCALPYESWDRLQPPVTLSVGKEATVNGWLDLAKTQLPSLLTNLCVSCFVYFV